MRRTKKIKMRRRERRRKCISVFQQKPSDSGVVSAHFHYPVLFQVIY